MAARTPQNGQWTYQFLNDSFVDPAVALITYCLPCVQYGMNAEKVHGPPQSCVNHGLKYCVYGCVCLGGLVGGPTRKAVRHAYNLPVQPELGQENPGSMVTPDCLVHTIPCTACFATCQEANELTARNVTSPLDPRDPFDWAPIKPIGSTGAATTAPVQEEMKKEVTVEKVTTTTTT